jgi:multicomponent Na+:H+ antiporter subunit E
MITFVVLFVSMLALYLLLVIGSGTGGDLINQLITPQEFIAALLLSLLSAGIARALLGKGESKLIRSPGKIFKAVILFPAYLVYLFYEMARANIDVAYRVITGRIKPGIVRIKPKLETDLGRTFLANSITLTPGTLSVDIDDETGDLFIHWINVQETRSDDERLKGTSGGFSKWARRITE